MEDKDQISEILNIFKDDKASRAAKWDHVRAVFDACHLNLSSFCDDIFANGTLYIGSLDSVAAMSAEDLQRHIAKTQEKMKETIMPQQQHINAFIVTLDANLLDENAQLILDAIKQLKHVIDVQPVVADATSAIALRRARYEVQGKVLAALDKD